jgi:hypothetical protein
VTVAMWVIIIVAVYVLCSLAAYGLFKWVWLAEFDLTRRDRQSFVILSLAGPMSLLGALFGAFEAWLDKRVGKDGEEVVEYRRSEREW